MEMFCLSDEFLSGKRLRRDAEKPRRDTPTEEEEDDGLEEYESRANDCIRFHLGRP